MNTKTKTLLGVAAFLIFLMVVSFAYSSLSKTYKPEQAQSTQSSSLAAEQSSQTGSTLSEQGSQSSTSQEQTAAAPDFTVFDADGKKVKLSDFKGKPVVLNFWASWCPPCKSELPDFDKAYAEAKDSVVFLMVDLTDGERETQEKAQSYVKSQGFGFPVYFDKELQAADAYEISAIPDTLFIDKDGNIVNSYQGAIDAKTLAAGIKAIQEEN